MAESVVAVEADGLDLGLVLEDLVSGVDAVFEVVVVLVLLGLGHEFGDLLQLLVERVTVLVLGVQSQALSDFLQIIKKLILWPLKSSDINSPSTTLRPLPVGNGARRS